MDVSKLIDIYLNGLVSVSNDAGWAGDSILSKMIEFGGEPPRGSGMDQSNTTMINALRNFRNKHKDFNDIERVVWRLASAGGTRRHVMALLVDSYYHGINPRSEALRAYTTFDKVALWVEHLNRPPWEDQELIRMAPNFIVARYRYSLYKAGPRLVRREMRKKQ